MCASAQRKGRLRWQNRLLAGEAKVVVHATRAVVFIVYRR